jgi:hypothetical protein
MRLRLPAAVTLVIFAASFTVVGATCEKHLKECETVIATTAKCATIGTVQESFPSVPRNGFFHVPDSKFSGQTSGDQVIGIQQLDEGRKPCASREPLLKISQRKLPGNI